MAGTVTKYTLQTTVFKAAYRPKIRSIIMYLYLDLGLHTPRYSALQHMRKSIKQ